MNDTKKKLEMVEYNSKMNEIAFHNFKAVELDLFMAVCYKMHLKGVSLVTLSFSEIFDILPSLRKNKNQSRIISNLFSMNSKLLDLKASFEDEEKLSQFTLFNYFEIFKKRKVVELKVNEKFAFIFNELKVFTRVELKYFQNFKSIYSRHLFKILKQFQNEEKNNEHWCYLSLEDLKNRLDIPKSYSTKELNRTIIKTVLKEIGEVLVNFKLDYRYEDDGKTIKGYKFSWETNNVKKEINEDIKKLEIIEENENIKFEEYWNKNFIGVKYTKKHKKVIEKLLKNNTVSYVKNELNKLWEFVQNSETAQDKKALFSFLVLKEQSAPMDLVLNKKNVISDEEDKIKAETFKKKLDEMYFSNEESLENKNKEKEILSISEIVKEEKEKIKKPLRKDEYDFVKEKVFNEKLKRINSKELAEELAEKYMRDNFFLI